MGMVYRRLVGMRDGFHNQSGRERGASERTSLISRSSNNRSGRHSLHASATYKSNSENDDKKLQGENKLDTFDGVFIPTALNVLSILMFLRFGYIIGRVGIIGMFVLLLLSYLIDFLTVLSISAISTNGTVKGGGAYYMISRSLGPEFGGAIGIIFFIGQVLNAALNVVGIIEPILLNFGSTSGSLLKVLPQGFLWEALYSSALLLLCTGISLVGSKLVSKTALCLFVALVISILSIPFSTLIVKPFQPLPAPHDDLWFTGWAWKTTLKNLWPNLSSSSTVPDADAETDNFQSLFGILFSATAGIFAGASMSGELKRPSKSIPSGTLYGLLVSFTLYSLVIISLGCSVPREILCRDINIIQTISLQGIIIIVGELATSLFSVIMGLVGAATLLSAIADDQIIPGISVCRVRKKSYRQKRKAEKISLLITWLLTQVFLFSDIDRIATFISMAFLMTFIVTNIACFLLRVGSAPNFRPSFKYFNTRTAFFGATSSIFALFIVYGLSAFLVIIFLMFLVIVIHYSTPPSKFGDISQLLIYHQVRKYLLRLKLQMNVKYWRPQILLLCDDARSSWNLIRFCNHLKKGGLYILGHVILMHEDEISVDSYREIQKQKQAWHKIRELLKIKAFIQIALGPTIQWGVRNVYLGSGLGGMRPNITIIGFHDLYKESGGISTGLNALPTDDCKKEQKINVNQWIQIIEELTLMQATVGVAINFSNINVPTTSKGTFDFLKNSKIHEPKKKKYIDLYPIQMSRVSQMKDGRSVFSTNFDTYTLILQLGAILASVPEWKDNNYVLRIIAFVQDQNDVETEKSELKGLLESLRIDAEVVVMSLDDGSLSSYNFLVKGYPKNLLNKNQFDRLDEVLRNEKWWKNLCLARNKLRDIEMHKLTKKTSIQMPAKKKHFKAPKGYTTGNMDADNDDSHGKSLNRRRYTLSNLHQHGHPMSLNMGTSNKDFFNYNSTFASDESDEDSESTLESVSLDQSSSRLSKSLGKVSTIFSTKRGHEREAGLKPKQKKSVLGKNKNRPFLSRENSTLENVAKRDISTDQVSLRSVRSSLRPNFVSVKTPQANMSDEDNIEENEGELDVDTKESYDQTESSRKGDYFGKHSTNINVCQDQSLRHGTSKESVPTTIVPDDVENSSQDHKPRSILEGNLGSASDGSVLSLNNEDLTEEASGSNHIEKMLQDELKSFSFNDLPAKGQHLILNELMSLYSVPGQTEVIFSTLPAPQIGTHSSDEESMIYATNLAIWSKNLPPMLLINSQTVTVTTAL
ncbi:Piso0_002767 [Millerozyma farinosa CBS 7064]|uniref:Piso0_002767 protein n=1 Tax=Pichia sorbitophila (strain ATCC MYA-4447 / BCRC 22081 / CBS 7064 / NBRC 10061 / NRRL Y-12695) TaxID=559304 RepID=G8YFX2_PICSO|nr:Piso0_002767 [Millerozyma farinosa CBS 7064]